MPPSTADETNSTPPEVHEDHPEAESRRPPRWFLSFSDVPLALFWGFLFWLVNNLNLPNGDLWGHVLYGDWILDHEKLPTEDPVMPLAEGIQVFDTTWLSQVILASVERAGGIEWLSHLFALMVVVTYAFLARACTLASGSKWIGLAGTLAALYLAWGRTSMFRAEAFGALCFTALLWLIVSARGFGGLGLDDGSRMRPWRLWLGIPALFVLWANLHPSFVEGLMILGCLAVGRAIDTARQTRNVMAVLGDRILHRWILLAELAIVATLINPYGFDLLLHVMGWTPQGVSRGPQGWQVAMQGDAGLAIILSWLLFTALAFWVGRKVPAAHVLLMVFFAAGAAAAIRNFTWYAPIFALLSVPLWAAAWDRVRSRWSGSAPASDEGTESRELDTSETGMSETGTSENDARGGAGCSGPSLVATLVCVVVLWAAFTFSPLGLGLMTDYSRSSGQLMHPSTPMAVTGWLRANPPQGQIFNPQAWGDWLAFEGPPDLKPFITSRIDQVPHPVWRSYQRLQAAGYEWERVFRRFRIDTVVVDTNSQRLLARAIRFTDGWSLAYDDGRAQVFVRNSAIEGGSGSGHGHGEAPEENSHE